MKICVWFVPVVLMGQALLEGHAAREEGFLEQRSCLSKVLKQADKLPTGEIQASLLPTELECSKLQTVKQQNKTEKLQFHCG